MKCPFCLVGETKVVDSRETAEGKSIRRRRECEKCKGRFSTYEQIESFTSKVIKRDGRTEEYEKEKLLNSIRMACNKRLDREQVDKIFFEIESEILTLNKESLTTREIGELCLKKLKERDEVAYLRYASVFKSFGSGKRFVREVGQLERMQ